MNKDINNLEIKAQEIYDLMWSDEIKSLTIYGERRSGKTTIVSNLIKQILDQTEELLIIVVFEKLDFLKQFINTLDFIKYKFNGSTLISANKTKIKFYSTYQIEKGQARGWIADIIILDDVNILKIREELLVSQNFERKILNFSNISAKTFKSDFVVTI